MDNNMMKPKHTKKSRVRVFSLSANKMITVQGYRLTKHFAVTPCIDYAGVVRGLWTVTNLSTGAKALCPVRTRRIAEIACRVMEALPVDWETVKSTQHHGAYYIGPGLEQLRSIGKLLRPWQDALMFEAV